MLLQEDRSRPLTGQLLVETAGGKVNLTPLPGHEDAYSIIAINGLIPVEEIL